MTILHNSLIKRVWIKLLGSHSWMRRAGTMRERELHGLVQRPNYAYGMLRAADMARYFGKSTVTVCEFGVATGNGLKNMVDLSEIITAETGVKFRICGFDTGKGLPPPQSYKDHPELWSTGDFSMGDVDALRARLGGKAELIIGDINDTIDAFTQSLREDAPLGFVSIDVDIYTGTVAALRGLTGDTSKYLPAISFYFDDVGSFFSNEACGELAAIAEFNQAHPERLISKDHSFPGRRQDPAQGWYKAMYVCHMLDHPDRQKPRERGALSLQDHMQLMAGLR